VLVRRQWTGAPLGELVHDQLVPFIEAGSPRLEISGPAIIVTTETAQAIGLAIHELATNAMKHGALSNESGSIRVQWHFTRDEGGEVLRLAWIEQGGPPLRPPARKGFGLVVLQDLVARSIRGTVAMQFGEPGLNWTLSIPGDCLIPSPGCDASG
jgi:two-component sensor histidine kinase